MDEKLKRMRELISILTQASRAYYQESREIMSNFEYDRLYDELLELEKETGTVLAGSPTQKVGYEIVSELPKERHERPMLSLNKTKSVEELREWLGNKKGLLSWKMDGLTVVLTYEEGVLKKAVTRGNGEIGEVITANARTFINLPAVIPFKGQLILRGEAVITYPDFERLNEAIPDMDARYKNPRNLCSGSVRQLNSEITAARNVRFMAFSLVQASEPLDSQANAPLDFQANEPLDSQANKPLDFKNSRKEQFLWLRRLGFETVEFVEVTADTLADAVETFAKRIEDYEIPSDGLVLLYDDIAYGQSLGRTSKFPRDSIAFKWQDEVQETTLSYIEWSASRTGLINPVAVFEPVELEGTTVSRASVHNISIMESLELGAGDTITVYKANMIIPQIADNLTRSGVRDIPAQCPVCGGKTEIRSVNDVKALYCTNPECQAKKIKSFDLFVSRDALNIDGLSEMTLEKFIGHGFIREFDDIFHLDRHRDEIVNLEGFGEKSYENLVEAAKKASHTTLPRLIYGLGIPGIGAANAKMICRHFSYDLNAMREADQESMCAIDGIGPVLAKAWECFFKEPKNQEILDHLLKDLTFEEEEQTEGAQPLAGKTFVITGSLEHFANRRELQERIEALGGKAAGSVSAKTDYLINNDVTSNSAKNRKARELGIPILSEEDFIKLTGNE